MEIFGRILLGLMLLWLVRLDISDRPYLITLLTSKKIPKPSWAFAAAVVLKLCGALSIIFHIYTPFFSFLLGLFFIGASCLFQDFWRANPEEKHMKTVLFVTNVALAGGMFLLS